MTLEQWQLCLEKKIRANFKSRNVRVFSSELRHKRILRERRGEICRSIASLRQARDPLAAPMVAEAVMWKIA